MFSTPKEAFIDVVSAIIEISSNVSVKQKHKLSDEDVYGLSESAWCVFQEYITESFGKE